MYRTGAFSVAKKQIVANIIFEDQVKEANIMMNAYIGRIVLISLAVLL